ncbi:MAG: SH3 domain-containing protein [Bauldia sp.]|nr:SH3 domain-containing protein [Bauldia sp.]
MRGKYANHRRGRWLAVFASVFVLLGPVLASAQLRIGPISGLPLPRFVSLKSDQVNVRRGPRETYDVAWTFVKVGLPVEVLEEYDTWRKIRDSEGAEGWVFHSLLAGKRTALVGPWLTEPVELRQRPQPDARVVALLEPNVLGDILACSANWCRLRGEGYDGWLPQETLWGVYPGEVIED